MVLNVGRHLTEGKLHALKKDSVEYRVMLKSAQPYTGWGEIQAHLPRPKEESETNSDSEPDHENSASDDLTQSSEGEELAELEESDEGQHLDQGEMGEEDEEGDQGETGEEDGEEDEEGDQGETDEEHEGGDEEEDDDSDSDFAQGRVKSKEYFTDHKFRNNRQRWLVGFFDYLSRPLAGSKKDSIRLQHASQVWALLEHIEPRGDDITCLAKKEGDAVWQLWVRPMLESNSKKPGTIISYLTSFEKFLKFVTNPRYRRYGAPIHPKHLQTFKTVLPEIKGWRSTVDSQTQDVQNQRFIDETEGILTVEEVQKLKTSKHYSDAEKILWQAEQGKTLKQSEFTTARDYLLTRFAIDCAIRPGPLNNAKVADYDSAESHEGIKVMLVAKHKRAKEGPAILAMLPDMQGFMETYVNKIRPHFTLKEKTKLFVTCDGTGFREGTIGRRLSSFCEKSGLRLGDRLASVDWRKLVSTKTKEKATPAEAKLVRRVMAHSEITAERSYVRSNLTKLGAEAVKVIARVTSVQEEKLKKGDVDSDSRETSSPGPSGTSDQQITKDAASNITPTSDCSVSLLSSQVVPPTPPPKLTEKQKQAIDRVFADDISRRHNVKIDLVQRKCCTTAVLSVLASSKKRVKQVTNYVNHLIGKQPAIDPKELPQPTASRTERWLEEFDEPSSRSTSRREAWDYEKAELLEKRFLTFTSLPSTYEIKGILQNESGMTRILEEEGWTRTYTKIKNLFKARQRKKKK